MYISYLEMAIAKLIVAITNKIRRICVKTRILLRVIQKEEVYHFSGTPPKQVN